MKSSLRLLVFLQLVLITTQKISAAWDANDDFDGDGVSDCVVLRQNFPWGGALSWFVSTSSGASPPGGGWTATTGGYWKSWGLVGDIPVPGDFSGEGVTDLAVFRPSNGTWYISYSTGAPAFSGVFGQNGDVPLAFKFSNPNFTTDSRYDMVIYRPGANTFFYRDSFNGLVYSTTGPAIHAGATVTATHDGGSLLIFQRYPSGAQTIGKWNSFRTSPPQWTDYPGIVMSATAVSMTPGSLDSVPAALFSYSPDTGVWTGYSSSVPPGLVLSVQWGLPGDVPLSSSFDGNVYMDYTVWRPFNGTFFVKTSSGAAPVGAGWTAITGRDGEYYKQWGLSSDTPLR